jgi:ABC-type transport system involved in multi-copper enzyme maturation permease subunit
MNALLRADLIRLRRRLDLWFIVAGVLVLAGISFVGGYSGDVADPPPFDRAAFVQQTNDSGMFVGMTQAEIDAQLPLLVADAQAAADADRADHEARQVVALQRYGLPQAPLTLLASSLFSIIALALIASLVVGDEFRFGTLRTSLLAASDRRRFLAARLISFLVLTVGLFVALVLVAVVLSLGLTLIGAELPPSAPINVPAAAGLVVTDILVATVVILLTTALSLIMRSGVLAFLVGLLLLLIDVFLVQLPVFQSLGAQAALAAVPQFSLTTAIRTLQAVLGRDTGGLAFADLPVPGGPLNLDPVVLAGILVAWGAVFLVVADRRIRRMDVIE